MRRAALALAALSLAGPAAADDLVWHFYPAEAGGTLAVMERSELESPEPYWHVSFQCIPDEDWTLGVADIDAKALAAAIADSGPALVDFAAGDGGDGLFGGFFPELFFGQMYGEWEYSVPIDISTLETLAGQKSLRVIGTGVDLKLPEAGMADGFAALITACSAL